MEFLRSSSSPSVEKQHPDHHGHSCSSKSPKHGAEQGASGAGAGDDENSMHRHHHCSKDPGHYGEGHNHDHFLDQVHNHETHSRHDGFIHGGEAQGEQYVAYADIRQKPTEDMFHHSSHRVKGHVHQKAKGCLGDKPKNDLFEDVHKLLQLVLHPSKLIEGDDNDDNDDA